MNCLDDLRHARTDTPIRFGSIGFSLIAFIHSFCLSFSPYFALSAFHFSSFSIRFALSKDPAYSTQTHENILHNVFRIYFIFCSISVFIRRFFHIQIVCVYNEPYRLLSGGGNLYHLVPINMTAKRKVSFCSDTLLICSIIVHTSSANTVISRMYSDI